MKDIVFWFTFAAFGAAVFVAGALVGVSLIDDMRRVSEPMEDVP